MGMGDLDEGRETGLARAWTSTSANRRAILGILAGGSRPILDIEGRGEGRAVVLEHTGRKRGLDVPLGSN